MLTKAWTVFITSGYWVRIAVFMIISLWLAFAHGQFWTRLLRLSSHPFELVSLGAISIFALEEFLCWPVVAFRLSASALICLTAAALLFPAGVGFFLPKVPHHSLKRIDRVILTFLCLLLFVTVISSVIEYHADTDDSFFVSNVALFANSDTINPYDSSMGDPTTGTMPMYDFQTWESLISVVCRLFHLRASETMHTLVIAPLLICSFSACFSFGLALFHDERKAALFLVCISVYHLSCRLYPYSDGAFLLRRTWQGKSVNLNVTLPLLCAALVRYFSSEEKKHTVTVWLCALAGVALNPTSLYVNGFALLFLSVALAMGYGGWKKSIALLPVVGITLLFTLMIYLRTKACAGMIEGASTVGDSFFFDTLQDFFSDRCNGLFLFALAELYVAFLGNKIARTCFILFPALMLVFLWNPWMGKLVASSITKAPTYWRVFWLLPIGSTVSWSVVDLACRIPKGRARRLLGFGVLLILVAAVGKWPSAKEYTVASNTEKISPNIIKVSDTLQSEHISTPVLACRSVATTLRQRDTELWLLVAKTTYIRDIYTSFGRYEEGADRQILYAFANGTLDPAEYGSVDGLLKKYNVHHVVLIKNNLFACEHLSSLGWDKQASFGSYRIYYR